MTVHDPRTPNPVFAQEYSSDAWSDDCLNLCTPILLSVSVLSNRVVQFGNCHDMFQRALDVLIQPMVVVTVMVFFFWVRYLDPRRRSCSFG